MDELQRIIGREVPLDQFHLSLRRAAMSVPGISAYGACLVLGFHGSRQAWRWPALVFGALFASAVVSAPGGLSLWPLTLILAGLMTAVGLLPAFVGVGLRRLFDARRARRAAADARLRTFLSETPPPPPA